MLGPVTYITSHRIQQGTCAELEMKGKMRVEEVASPEVETPPALFYVGVASCQKGNVPAERWHKTGSAPHFLRSLGVGGVASRDVSSVLIPHLQLSC